MRIIVVGSSGLLGRKIYHVLSRNHNVGGYYFSNPLEGHRKLDIRRYKDVSKAFKRINPDVIVHTSALCDADFSEKNQNAAYKVNVVGTHNIVRICKEKKSKLVFISSDYVFDGNSGSYFEDSDPNPINYYGQTKLEGERIIKEELNDFVIIRPTILYGFNDENNKPTFLSNTIEKLRASEALHVDGYVKKYPLLIDDLALFVERIIEKGERGIFHIKGSQAVTRYEWALEIADVFGTDKGLVKKTKSVNIAKKPQDVNLETNHEGLMAFTTVDLNTGIRIYKMQRGCVFKLLYSARPETSVMEQSVSRFRIKDGQALASEHPVDADIVVPVPESGIFPATGYSQKSRKPLMFGVVRDYITRRTLFTSSIKSRLSMIESKLLPIPDLIKNKKVILIDEAILSGTTLKILCRKMRDSGVSEIHIRVSSPEIIRPCFARMHPVNFQLAYSKYKRRGNGITYEKFLAGFLEVDSVAFLSLDGIKKAIDNRLDERCFYCFGGEEH